MKKQVVPFHSITDVICSEVPNIQLYISQYSSASHKYEEWEKQQVVFCSIFIHCFHINFVAYFTCIICYFHNFWWLLLNKWLLFEYETTSNSSPTKETIYVWNNIREHLVLSLCCYSWSKRDIQHVLYRVFLKTNQP